MPIPKIPNFALFLSLILFTAACTSFNEPMPTAVSQSILPTATPGRVLTTSPTAKATLPPPAASATHAPTLEPTSAVTSTPYRVAFVADNDVLNVRSGPGVENNIVSTLSSQAANIQITGAGVKVADSTWVPILAGPVSGWVNSRFLTPNNDPDAFCNSTAVDERIVDFISAVATRDNALLAQLIHPERGVRIHTYWWNTAVLIKSPESTALFESTISHDWGIADGTGDAIIGTFNEIILPRLTADLLPAADTACNEILHGGTAGLITLPDGYDQIAYRAYYRPGTDQYDGLDWGTWVIGLESWQENLFITYLIHYQWEI